MSAPIYNLHNHTPFSDGAYTVDELCEAHLARNDINIAGIGISDHLFCTPSSRVPVDERDFERIFERETRAYVDAMRAARERWAGRIQVFIGCEVSWPRNHAFMNVLRTMLGGIDYVLFEHLDWAALTQLANQAKRFPCPVGLAHTDVSVQMPHTSIDQVVRTLANARIFYELNAKYVPLPEGDRWYNTLPNHRVPVSLGTDTHDSLATIGMLREMHAYLCRRGLESRIFVPRVRDEMRSTAAEPTAAAVRTP